MKKIIGVAACIAYIFVIFELRPATVNAKAAYRAKIYATFLNVRSEPATNAAVTGSLKKGAMVTVTDEKYGWMKVQAGRSSGWVAGYYLKKVSSFTGSAGSTSTGSIVEINYIADGNRTAAATVIADSLRIRSGPGTTYSIEGSLKAGDSVTPLLRQNEWMKIHTNNGEMGWVAAQYVRSGISQGSAIQSVKSSGSVRGKLIVIDPGHGGSDPGMLGTTYNTMEKDLNLETALYVRDYLKAEGARVEMTRTADRKVALSRRVGVSESLNADAFVSIHYNSSPKKVSGTLTFYYSESEDLLLARAIETRLGQGIGLKSNGLSFGDYHILRENSTPSALIELGFLSNPNDEGIVRNSSYQRKAAKAIAVGLADYFKR
ncbi:N-acetylmuramoyl-L-alanine amidase [Paenibacillus wynnii]|uniref:N-acetylmuramoyl-L-alanine amidase n=1 Tax=Paenibacillus wynnii TaxID=268407 RepID=UPI0027945D7F|nr:N-acetylmuramoyl-L-alanine amidase [Paenibacillus wynnii]MDQ0194962.1 N-acetylmuramoyl-L-alanine amidase [Paenibacillus wynnii]